ncbi:MAG: hypothetical protein GVY08_13485 [Bacteroidetes bacterium]|nr:hypothetical protein [Bacteroidota bacterium]
MNKTTISILLTLLFLPGQAVAQMFSVGNSDDRPDTRLRSYTTAGISWEFADFQFVGEDLPIADRADFEEPIIRLRFETPGLKISAGFGGSLTGMDERSYVNLNALLFNDFALYRSPRFIFAIPLQITTDLKSVTLEQSSNSFRQSSFVFGTGASMRYKISPRAGLVLRATPNLGFSFPQGALDDGGRLFTTTSSARFYFNEIIGSNSLVFGYDFDFRDYNIEGDRSDYEFLSHSFTIGIAF